MWFYCADATEYARLYVYPQAVLVYACVCVCVYTNGKADGFESVQAVQSLLGLGQVLRKLGMQQPHGERHHGAWTRGREDKKAGDV